MGKLRRKVIHCPKSTDHPHKKILLLLGHKELNVHCPNHKWLRIELMRGGEIIDFDNVAAKVTEIDEGTSFELDPIPVIGIGEFKDKIKYKGAKKCQQ